MRRTFGIIRIIALLSCFAGARAVSSQTLPASSAIFDHITDQDGLPHKLINAIVQDNLGFLWIGTPEGLCRYDGNSFITYKMNPHDSNAIIHNSIAALATDSKGNIWCAVHGGISMFDP